MTDAVLTLTGWDIATITLLLTAVGFTLFLFGKWDGQRMSRPLLDLVDDDLMALADATREVRGQSHESA